MHPRIASGVDPTRSLAIFTEQELLYDKVGAVVRVDTAAYQWHTPNDCACGKQELGGPLPPRHHDVIKETEQLCAISSGEVRGIPLSKQSKIQRVCYNDPFLLACLIHHSELRVTDHEDTTNTALEDAFLHKTKHKCRHL